MNKKVPMRKCVGCNESKPKKELIRITATEDGVMPDSTGKANGRGVYLCRGCKECFEIAKKRRAIGRGLQIEITEEAMAKLEKELEKYEI